jgi:hypothetical protein
MCLHSAAFCSRVVVGLSNATVMVFKNSFFISERGGLVRAISRSSVAEYWRPGKKEALAGV